MVKPNPKYLMQADVKRKNQLMEWLRNSKMTRAAIIVATFSAALGLGKMHTSSAEKAPNKQPIENTTPIPTAEAASVPTVEDAFGYSDPNEFVETAEEREAREAEEEFLRIERGEYVHGDAGMKQNYKLGAGAPQMTDDDYQQIYEAKSAVGTGMSHEEMYELREKIRKNSGLSEEQMQRLEENAAQSVSAQENIKGIRKNLKDGKISTVQSQIMSIRDAETQR